MSAAFERLERALGCRAPTAPEPAEERRAAVAVILRGLARDVLLMRRAEDPRDRWSGQISLPGGHHDAADPDLLATAARESMEEVGVDPRTTARLLGQMPALQARARGVIVPMRITPFVFALKQPVSPIPGPEASEAFWFPLERAATGEFDDVYRYRREDGLIRKLPAWRFEGRVIWGLTYQMLSSVIDLMGQP